MLADVATQAAKVGLELHPEKTKIMHNNIGYGSKVCKTEIEGMSIEVLGNTASAMYLGRALSLSDTHDVELKHRMKKAWAKFWIWKQELTDRDVPLRLRLKLFQSVITPTALYGCSSWVMTGAREAELQTTQMKMLRSMLGRRRRNLPDGELETWVDWIKHTTADARAAMEAHGVRHWVVLQQCKVKNWAGELEAMSTDRWTKRVLSWQPDGCRSRGHPRARWSDQLRNLMLSP